MLNVDQHNYNAKRQNNPMTVDEFKRNLKKVNGDADFDQDMLEEIYISIKCVLQTKFFIDFQGRTGVSTESMLLKRKN